MAHTKEQLVSVVKEWVTLETEIKTLQKHIKERRARKKELTSALVDTMKTNEIDCFDISDGKILYSQNKVKAPVSKKHLMSCLSQYFEKSNPDVAQELTTFILESREVNLKDNIRFKEPK
jgi:flagellar basal body rod protein FlgG